MSDGLNKLATALTISPITYLFKAFRVLGLRSFDVEGREILLKALEEPSARTGSGVTVRDGEKGELRRLLGSEDGAEGRQQRRGIVTSEWTSLCDRGRRSSGCVRHASLRN